MPPDNLIFAAVDFEAESLVDELARSGVDVSVPTFFSWLGVSMYLTREQAEVRYFTGRADALRTPRRVSIATATV